MSVVPAEAGIQNTVKFRVKPGMTKRNKNHKKGK
jgi:hypothetical protein